MIVRQRGTTSTAQGFKTVDRFQSTYDGLDEASTQGPVDVDSGTTPYTLGFRKAFRITNGNQTSGAAAGDYISFYQSIESKTMWTSGWNYTSSSSYITLSFWVKSSVAQSFHGYLDVVEGTRHLHPFETGVLSANTWTKITKVIPGNSNLTFSGANTSGLNLILWPYLGTSFTDNSVSFNSWNTYSSGARFPDVTTTWYTTNDATFDVTGMQLELGSTASSFVHEPEEETLRKCQRYCYAHVPTGSSLHAIMNATQYNSTTSYGYLPFQPKHWYR